MGSIRLVYPRRMQAVTGYAQEIVNIPTPLSVRDLIMSLIERSGKEFKEEIGLKSPELGETTPFYLVLVDRHRIPESRNFEAVIADGVEVVVSSHLQRRVTHNDGEEEQGSVNAVSDRG